MLDKSPEKIKKMFNDIAENYDFLNKVISWGTHKFVKSYAISKLDIKPNTKVLDVCCGSGDLSRIIFAQNSTCKIIGIDFSEEMLNIAQKHSKNIQYLQQDATNLNFADNSFDYVVMGFGLRNIENQQAALSEIYRVLKPHGKFLQLDFVPKSLFGNFYDKITLLLAKIFSNNVDAYKYLINSKNTYLPPKQLIKFFEKSGFHHLMSKNLLFNMVSFQIMKKNS